MRVLRRRPELNYRSSVFILFHINLFYYSLFMDYGIRQVLKTDLDFLPSSKDCTISGSVYKKLCDM